MLGELLLTNDKDDGRVFGTALLTASKHDEPLLRVNSDAIPEHKYVTFIVGHTCKLLIKLQYITVYHIWKFVAG